MPAGESKSTVCVVDPIGFRLSAPFIARYDDPAALAMAAALPDQLCPASGVKTPTVWPGLTPDVLSVPAAVRAARFASSVPAGSASPLAVNVAVCLSSSHSSDSAENSYRKTGPASPTPAYTATGSVAR